MSAPNPALDDWEFCTEEPNWVNLPSDASHHIGVVEDSTYYKALIELESGTYRWWAWKKSEGRMPYGPDLPPAIVQMLLAYMDEQ